MSNPGPTAAHPVPDDAFTVQSEFDRFLRSAIVVRLFLVRTADGEFDGGGAWILLALRCSPSADGGGGAHGQCLPSSSPLVRLSSSIRKRFTTPNFCNSFEFRLYAISVFVIRQMHTEIAFYFIFSKDTRSSKSYGTPVLRSGTQRCASFARPNHMKHPSTAAVSRPSPPRPRRSLGPVWAASERPSAPPCATAGLG